MSRAAKIRVDLDAIRHNFRLARSLSPDSNAAAIIKANAYGHGAVEVAKALESEADASGVACIEEGVVLVEAGINIIEALDLEGIAATNATDFGFVLAHLSIVGATGSPARPLALIEP